MTTEEALKRIALRECPSRHGGSQSFESVAIWMRTYGCSVSTELEKAVRAVVRDCLGVSSGEEVLVVCNPATRGLGERMQAEAQEAGADSTLAVIAERNSHAAEPPRPVAAAMAAADVVLAPTVQSLSHTAARKVASEAGVRIATLPGVTEEMLARVMSADMEELRRRGAAVAAALDSGQEARITCDRGSDLRFGLEGRTAIPDAGELTARGAFGNLPCGEGFIAPLEGTGEGTLVVDGSIASVGRVKEPVTLTVRGGHLADASGTAGARLLELLTAHGSDGSNVAELGIGTNEKAILTGNILEDEKILGTAHVAFGASAAIGGTVQVPVHLDCVVLKPTVEIDGEPLVRDGELLV
jgi:aminopeptidase